MDALSLEHFLLAAKDYEGAQYRVLDGLQRARQAFARNVIYPYLGELIKLFSTLNGILRQFEGIREASPGSVQSIDPRTYRVIYEKAGVEPGQLEPVEDLIRWALPFLQGAIDEGRMVFEFVEDHLYMEEVGIVPSYVEEGYLMLPDARSQQLHIIQYTLSVFTHSDERFRSLKTAYVKRIAHQGVFPSPQSLKLDLVAENRTLPNPATYFFSTDLDFPFEATLLPVAKRKLIQHLTLQEGKA